MVIFNVYFSILGLERICGGRYSTTRSLSSHQSYLFPSKEIFPCGQVFTKKLEMSGSAYMMVIFFYTFQVMSRQGDACIHV